MVTYRERRHADTLREIKDIAMRHVAEEGSQALSLRAVARDMGMSVPSLYHYVASRDDLLTALVADGFDSLADALTEARDAVAQDDVRERLRAAVHAYRLWAHQHPQQFRLIYGAPLPGGHTPGESSATATAASRTGALFAELYAQAFQRGLLAVDTGAGGDPAPPGVADRLPPPVLEQFLDGWARMHGLVALEAFGHTRWLGGDADARVRRRLDALVDATIPFESA